MSGRGRLLVVGLGALSAAVAGWLATRPSPERAQVTALLDAYREALATGSVEEAYDRFTSERYRGGTGRIIFVAGQARNRDELGVPVRLRLDRDPLETHVEPGRGAFQRAIVWWEGERGSARVVFDLVREAGELRIDRTWSWPEGRLGSERVF